MYIHISIITAMMLYVDDNILLIQYMELSVKLQIIVEKYQQYAIILEWFVACLT